MFCEPYNKSLIDDAASGEPLSSPVQQHLASCESCQRAFAEEQSLFAAIESGLRAAANSEVPATLIPRVRVGLVDAPQPRRFSVSIMAMAGATVAVTAIIAFFYLQSHAPSPRIATNPAPASNSANQVNPVSTSTVNSSAPRSVSPLQHDAPVTLGAGRSSNPKSPEVIVAPEEGAALLRYEVLLRKTRTPGFHAASSDSLDVQIRIEPLEIAEIELGELKIPSLTKPDSDGDTK